MRIGYYGGELCSPTTYKRLLSLADEITFMDRPSVRMPKWGTIGWQSPAHAVVRRMAETPVPVSIYAPPSGPAGPLYGEYIEADLTDQEFRRLVLDGLASDETFAGRFLQPEAQFSSMRGNYISSGRDVVRALITDETLLQIPTLADPEGNMYCVRDEIGRSATLAIVLTEASILLTSAMLLVRETGVLPVTDDPYLSRLLARRTDQPYVKGTPARAAMLGLAIAQSVIPDEALQRLGEEDIIEYRKAAKDAYTAWSTELNRLAAELDDTPAADLEKKAAHLIATRVAPKVQEYRQEMRSARDKLFGDLIKAVAKWEAPTLTMSYLMGVPFGPALLAFAGMLMPAIPGVVDYLTNTRQVQRKNEMSYLIGLAKEAE